MAVRFPVYEMRDGQNGTRLNAAYFNGVWRDFDSRLDTLEQLHVSWASAVAELQQFGLARIDQYIGPLIDETEATLEAAQTTAALLTATADTALDDINAALDAALDTVDSSLDAQLDSVNGSLDAALDAVAADLSSQTTTVNNALAAQTTTVNSTLSAQTTTVNNAIAALNASVAATLAIPAEYGDGRDGHLKLGSISATTSTAPTVAVGAAGDLNTTYYYKYSAYNLSGETAVSSASSSVAPANKQVIVSIPGTVNNTNITGFYVYRSTSAGGTYYRVGTVPVDDATQGATFVDNYGISSGIAPQGSNTTSANATTDGVFYVKSANVASGQTVTVTADTSIGLTIISRGDITVAGSIVGTGKQSISITKFPICSIQKTNFSTNYTYTGISLDGNDAGVISNATGDFTTLGIGANAASVLANIRYFMNQQGAGGSNGTAKQNAGATILLAAFGSIDISSSTFVSSGLAGGLASGVPSGGAAGGAILLFGKKIKRTSATLTVSGGAGTVATSGTRASSGGGGGGLIAFITDYLIGSSTNSVAGGASAAGYASGTSRGASGGAFIGNGGETGGSTGASTAGTAGYVLEASPKKLSFVSLL